MKEIAQELIELEREFNCIPQAGGIPIGSLLTDFWRQLYDQAKGKTVKNRHWFLQFLSVLKYVFLFIIQSKQKKITAQSTKLLICKSAEKQHFNKLIDFIPETIIDSEIVDSDYKKIYSCLSISERFRAIESSVRTMIRVIFKCRESMYNSKYSNKSLNFNLAISLIKFYGSVEFLKKKKFALVLVDYDRNKFAPIVLAANNQKVKTVSLQHGVINPPYGYVPILASEIWVWGGLWKDLLMSMDVPEERIKIIGSTIVDKFGSPRITKKIGRIGIGPNPIGDNRNERIWKQLVSLLMQFGYDVTIKLHPSMDKSRQGEKVFGRCTRILNAGDISNQEFFESIDLLIISNSGLGYEAVMAGTPVAVLKENDASAGNDFIMIKEGGFPELEIDVTVKETLQSLSDSLDQIFNLEQRFLREKVFSRSGEDARQNIISNIKMATYESL